MIFKKFLIKNSYFKQTNIVIMPSRPVIQGDQFGYIRLPQGTLLPYFMTVHSSPVQKQSQSSIIH